MALDPFSGAAMGASAGADLGTAGAAGVGGGSALASSALLGPWGIGAAVGAQLLGSILGIRSKREQQKREMIMQGINQQADAIKGSSQAMSTGERGAFNDMLSGYSRALT